MAGISTSATGYTHFAVKKIKDSDLTTVDFVIPDVEEQRVQCISILGAPLDLPVGDIQFRIEQKVSKKGNMLNWYKSHKTPSKATAVAK